MQWGLFPLLLQWGFCRPGGFYYSGEDASCVDCAHFVPVSFCCDHVDVDPWSAFLDAVSAGLFHHAVPLLAFYPFVTDEDPLDAGLCCVDIFWAGFFHYTVGPCGESRFYVCFCRSNVDSLGADILGPLSAACRVDRIYDRGDHYGNGGPSIWCHVASAYAAT